MRYVKWSFLTLIFLIIVAFFHYTLPQRDIVRIVNTYEERQDFGWNGIFWAGPNAGSATAPNRDVLFIQTVLANGNPMVYRNEDTGWGWPPYFKFDTANLQTEAADAVSNRDAPEWYAMTHYGWRIELCSAFTSAVGLRPVVVPDATLIPLVNLVFFVLLAIVLFALWRVWVRFRRRRIDPVLEDIDEASDEVRGRARGLWRRITGR